MEKIKKMGVIKPSYIKVIADNVNDGLYEQQDKINYIEDISSILLDNRVFGIAPESYHKKLRLIVKICG